MKACIGIISYFPDDEEVRDVRLRRLNSLLMKCDEIFQVPIIVIAQNGYSVNIYNPKNSTIQLDLHKEKLGIVGARKRLRELFLESDYDYLIMIDDDSRLIGNRKGGEIYLSQLENHPGCGAQFKPSLLKLFAISKDMYSKIVYPDGGADCDVPNMRYFEDMYLSKCLNRLYHDKKFNFRYTAELREASDAAGDKGNSGGHEVYKDEDKGGGNRHDTGDYTRGMMDQATKELLLDPSGYDRTKRMKIEEFKKKWGAA